MDAFNRLADYNLQNVYLKGLVDSQEQRESAYKGCMGGLTKRGNRKGNVCMKTGYTQKQQRRVKVITRNKYCC